MKLGIVLSLIISICIATAVIAKSNVKKPKYTLYCGIDGFLCRDWPGRYYVSYVLDKNGDLIPCKFKDHD